VKQNVAEYNTPFLLAAKTGKFEVVKFLVEMWPEGVMEGDSYANTPLHLAAAARLGTSTMMMFLVEQWPKGVRERST
jgi:ankyrin repeat protein